LAPFVYSLVTDLVAAASLPKTKIKMQPWPFTPFNISKGGVSGLQAKWSREKENWIFLL
jgi:hypothetical protein